MSQDYRPQATLNPMSRTQLEAMTEADRMRFFLQGGKVFDDPTDEPDPKELETMTSQSGQTITRAAWDAMTPGQQAAFVGI